MHYHSPERSTQILYLHTSICIPEGHCVYNARFSSIIMNHVHTEMNADYNCWIKANQARFISVKYVCFVAYILKLL